MVIQLPVRVIFAFFLEGNFGAIESDWRTLVSIPALPSSVGPQMARQGAGGTLVVAI